MQKSERIVRYTAAEIDERLARGEDQTDWAYIDSLTEEELEASIDWEDEGEFDWSRVSAELPFPVRPPATVDIERDVIAWFRAHHANFRTRMSTVLRRHVVAQKATSTPTLLRRQRRAT